MPRPRAIPEIDGAVPAPAASRRGILAMSMLGLTFALAGCGGSGNGSAGSNREGIWKVSAAGGDPKLIANSPDRPCWAPDGTRIAWSNENGVWIASSEGVDAIRVLGVRSPSPPSFSPDGSRIAVMDPERHALHIVDRDGRNASTYLIGNATHGDSSAPSVQRNIPAWAPDGKAILVSGWNGNGDSIYRVDAATGQAAEIAVIRTSNIPFDTGKPENGNRAVANAVWPGWSPDGRTIAFAALPQVSGGQGGILSIAVQSGDQRRLAPVLPSFGPLWSPDGGALLAVAPTDKGVRLVRISSQSGDMSAFPMPDGLVPIDADWSPDGSRIAFSASGAIHVMDVATGQFDTLADSPLVDLSPVWSPDGAWIAFRSELDTFDQPVLPPSP